MKKKHKKIISAIIILLLFFYYITNNNSEVSNSKQEETLPVINNVTSDLNIYYFDVGQADSILIQNNNTNMLIDAGNNADGNLLVDYIKNKLQVTKIDIVMGTHPHEDHIGGLDDIINNFEVNEVYLPEVITTTKTFEDVIEALENNDLEDRKNAFDSMIYLKYKEENLINDKMKNICITRLIYNLEEDLDKVDSVKITFEIDGAMKVFEM